MINSEFNNDNYMLVKVRYGTGEKAVYTYACKKGLSPKVGDYAVVQTHSGQGLSQFKVVEIGAVTANVDKHLPDMQIKEVIITFTKP